MSFSSRYRSLKRRVFCSSRRMRSAKVNRRNYFKRVRRIRRARNRRR